MSIASEASGAIPVRAEYLQAALTSHPGVRDAIVASWTSPAGAPQLIAYVVPAMTSAPTAAGLEDDLLRRWEHLWSMLYQQGDPAEPEFDIRGWHSSYTRKLLADEEMRDWVDQTVASIRRLGARSTLEIGCGSGLLLHRLAPTCDRYLATDFSAAALKRLVRQVGERGLGDIVELRHAPAHDLSSVSGEFDAVVLNSVIQYFPTAAYLTDVLEQAVARTCDNGAVFVGDVYSLALREAVHTSIVAHQASPRASRELLRSRVLHRIANQVELLMDPGFFVALAARLPRITAVEARPKVGRHTNEMTSFRYDVVLEVGGPGPVEVDVPWHDWRREHLDVAALRTLLAQPAGKGFGVSNIPNARVTGWLRAWTAINRPAQERFPYEDMTGSAAGEGLTADDLHGLTAGTPYHVSVSCLSGRPDLSLDAVWLPRGTRIQRPAMPGPAQGIGRHHNDPLWGRAAERLIRDLRDHLRRQLGQPATTATLICVDEIPPSTAEPDRPHPGASQPSEAGGTEEWEAPG